MLPQPGAGHVGGGGDEWTSVQLSSVFILVDFTELVTQQKHFDALNGVISPVLNTVGVNSLGPASVIVCFTLMEA